MGNTPPIALTIAGSDSSGGAGIQADIKTLSAFGVYSASVITCITAQNTRSVDDIFTLPSSIIKAQLESVFSDLNVQAVKIGMLGNSENIEVVASTIEKYRIEQVVLDPVLVATHGQRLLDENAFLTLKTRLLPLTSLLTPNIPEAFILLGDPVTDSEQEMRSTIRRFSTLGNMSVLLKGGHLSRSNIFDLLLHDDKVTQYPHQKIETTNTHGTGCTLSSAITAGLALGQTLPAATKHAVDYVQKALVCGKHWEIGTGQGPLNHFYKQE